MQPIFPKIIFAFCKTFLENIELNSIFELWSIEKVNFEEKFANFDAWWMYLKEFICKCIGKL